MERKDKEFMRNLEQEVVIVVMEKRLDEKG